MNDAALEPRNQFDCMLASYDASRLMQLLDDRPNLLTFARGVIADRADRFAWAVRSGYTGPPYLLPDALLSWRARRAALDALDLIDGART